MLRRNGPVIKPWGIEYAVILVLLHVIFLGDVPNILANSLKVALQDYRCILFALFVKVELGCQYGEETKQKRKKICCGLIAYRLRRLTSPLQPTTTKKQFD